MTLNRLAGVVGAIGTTYSLTHPPQRDSRTDSQLTSDRLPTRNHRHTSG